MKISDLEFFLVEIPRTSLLPPVRSLLGAAEHRRRAGRLGRNMSELAAERAAARRDVLLPVLAGRSIFDIEELHTLEPLASPSLRCGDRDGLLGPGRPEPASRCAACWAANIGGGSRWRPGSPAGSRSLGPRGP